jgi:hypothetical protein
MREAVDAEVAARVSGEAKQHANLALRLVEEVYEIEDEDEDEDRNEDDGYGLDNARKNADDKYMREVGDEGDGGSTMFACLSPNNTQIRLREKASLIKCETVKVVI